MKMTSRTLFNPDIEGDPFFWEGGPVGVLLLHGFTATTAEVRPFAKKLLQAGCTTAGPLLAGHGTSPEELNRTPWKAWVQSAEEVYQNLKTRCEKVFVVGESAGAVIALYLAGEHPEIALLILASPALKLNLKPIQLLEVRLLAPFVKALPKGGLDGSDGWQGYPVNPLKGVLQLLQLGKIVTSRLPLISQPVQIFLGRNDTTIDQRSGEIILNKVCSRVKELTWMENSSHCVLLDQELDQVTEKALLFIHRNG
jgi:carboxylesterase